MHVLRRKEHCQCCFLQKFCVGYSFELHNCIAKHGNRQIMKKGKDKKNPKNPQDRSCPLQLLSGSWMIPTFTWFLRGPLSSQRLKAFRWQMWGKKIGDVDFSYADPFPHEICFARNRYCIKILCDHPQLPKGRFANTTYSQTSWCSGT